MITAAVDWTVLGVGALTAVASLAGGLAVTWLQGRHSERGRRLERAHEDRVARRDAYLELLSQIDRLAAFAEGAMALSGPLNVASSDHVEALLAASVKAELYADPATWAQMHPLVEAVSMKGNALSLMALGRSADHVVDALRKLGGDTAEGWELLRSRYLAAARRELGVVTSP